MSTLKPKPLNQPFFTPATLVLMVIMGIGFSFGIARLIIGLEDVTNLNNYYPWGIWIAIDVACGVALAAGGFTTAALIDIFGRKQYKAFLRPAVLTAWLGYMMVAVGLMFDLGRYWNIYQPALNWQGNSVMFELAMCVMAYLIVLTFEISPSILEGLKARISQDTRAGRLLKKIEKPIVLVHTWIKTVLPILIIAGVVLSCMHQSSLGTLMVIAPTKLSALWYTPWLPLLFLLSAIMVGFPMVVIESLLSSRGLNRESEMELLAPLAAKIPWFIGIYALFKFGDLIARFQKLDFVEHPGSTVSFAIEICLGLILPFILLLMKPIRRSRGWLFTASFLVIFGVALNRINVFLVGYNPPHAEFSYFPSIGEISLTVGLIATLIFLYRLVVNYFPILPSLAPSTTGSRVETETLRQQPLQAKLAWFFRGSAIVFLVSFVILYAVVHKGAIASSQQTYGEVLVVKTGHDDQTAKPKDAFPHLNRPEKYRNFYMINSPVLNDKTDYYEPVRFSHRTHDVNTGTDCAVCHHRISFSDDDRVGESLAEMHESIEVRIGGACATCHEDMNDKEIQKCADCHLFPNESDSPARIGLKGAYHRQCIGCHIEQPTQANAPTDCKSCHHPHTPDHSELINLPDETTALQVTAECLRCHPNTGEDLLKTAHWNWKGLTPDITGHEHQADIGLFNVMDNFTITMLPDLTFSSSYHAGYGLESREYDFSEAGRIDCLICHDTTGTYRKDQRGDGSPEAGVNLKEVAANVGRPSRDNCGSCHYYFCLSPNARQGDLEPALNNPAADFDVHMGMANMRCQDCHTTSEHTIAGMSFHGPALEGKSSCEQCHGDHPHGISGYLSRHLDDHVRAIACETCHIPSFAKISPTLLETDFSSAGMDREIGRDEFGQPTYDKNRGNLTWGRDVLPVYRWFDGSRGVYLMGDKINPSGINDLNSPMGERHNPKAKIYPFKIHLANQPYDVENNTLAPVKFKGEFLDNFDWNRAIESGSQSAGLDYSGKFAFTRTRVYTSIHHGVVPAAQALGCSDCHQVEAITCTRCHQNAKGMDLPSHTKKIYPGINQRLDFGKLGYINDPALVGGRFHVGLGRGKPLK